MTQTNVIIACLYPEVTFDHSRFETFAHLSRQQAIFWWKMANVAFFGAQNVGFGQKNHFLVAQDNVSQTDWSLMCFSFIYRGGEVLRKMDTGNNIFNWDMKAWNK